MDQANSRFYCESCSFNRGLYLNSVLSDYAMVNVQRQSFIAEWRDQYVYFLLDIQRGFAICSRDNLVSRL